MNRAKPRGSAVQSEAQNEAGQAVEHPEEAVKREPFFGFGKAGFANFWDGFSGGFHRVFIDFLLIYHGFS